MLTTAGELTKEQRAAFFNDVVSPETRRYTTYLPAAVARIVGREIMSDALLRMA